MQDSRNFFRVGNYRVLVELDEGHPEDALQTCLTMFRLARLLDHNPLLMGYLVCLAERSLTLRAANLVLRAGPLPESDYAALEQELALQDLVEPYRLSLRSDRAYGLQFISELSSRDFMAPVIRLMPLFKNDFCDYLDIMEKSIQDASRPYAQWKSDMDSPALEESVGPTTRGMFPVLRVVHDAMTRVQAQLRALRVLNALLQREQAGGTGEPALTDLGLPADVVTDPFNGEPLHIKKLPAGWLIYSVGQNLEDDGGDLTDYLDVGLGPLAEPKPAKNSDEPAP
jgi:hypothetical protein